MRFIGRVRELAALRKEFDKRKPSLIVAYGRRRIGKSRLLREAAAGRPEIYFQATRAIPPINLAQFKVEVAKVLGSSPVLDALSSFEGVLHFVSEAASKDQGLILTIDEFPYLVDNDASLPSILQRFWDSGMAHRGNLKIVLCGSAIAQMEELLAERNPLYGRKTMSLELRQMNLREIAEFFPHYRAEDIIHAYATFGGVPHYLNLCDPDVDLRENTIALLLSSTGPLLDEPMNLLQSELREPTVYNGIIDAVAKGHNEAGRIADHTGIKATSLPSYLATLDRLHLVSAVRSLDAERDSRKRRFVLNDHLMRFWHEFVRPSMGAIVNGHGEAVFDNLVRRKMPTFMGAAFETLCRQHAAEHLDEVLGIPSGEVGSIWGHADLDVDLAGRTVDGTYFYGECKWRAVPFDMGMLDLLISRAERVSYGRGSPGKQYLIYSKTGCKADVLSAARVDTSIHYVSLEDMVFGTRPGLDDGNETAAAPSP